MKKSVTVKDLMEYLSTEDRPVKPGEFKDFWAACSESDKEYFKNALSEILG